MLLGGTLCDVLLGNRVERHGMIMVATHTNTHAHSHMHTHTCTHTHTHTHTHTLPHLGAAKWKINVDKPPSEQSHTSRPLEQPSMTYLTTEVRDNSQL